ncbi:MAG: filamentous hemagglutinin N-terminal domain-containing protein [Rickettsiales bacterium]|nr:filamentous hemagglutinin N-terminal domain-containing protein [Rickettsiales bacterium]
MSFSFAFPHQIATTFSRIFCHLLLISLVFNPIAALAQTPPPLPITPDGSTNTQVTQTASGVDQINIAAPNAGGLSHNKFTDYNVNQSGQVINNFSGKVASEIAAGTGPSAITATQIAGFVTVNPNLQSSGSARVILNEVTSASDTQLLGYTEIAGTNADLILANSNGITCRGCGFINTARLTFIAGSSNFDASGNLGFNLKEQSNPSLSIPLITVEGLGLDVTKTSSAEIIASSIKILANIYGADDTNLTIKSGEGRFDYQSKNITNSSTSLALGSTPLFAIDAASLVKIQAGKIFIIATREGVGVNMASEVLASNEVKIDANGDVYYDNISAENKVDVQSTKNISSIGSSSAISAPNLALKAGGEFKNLGSVAAHNLDILNSTTFTNLGTVEALALNLSNITNINNSGSLFGENSLTISGANLTNNSGALISAILESSQINLSGDLQNYGELNSKKDLTIDAKNLRNFGNILATENGVS